MGDGRFLTPARFDEGGGRVQGDVLRQPLLPSLLPMPSGVPPTPVKVSNRPARFPGAYRVATINVNEFPSPVKSSIVTSVAHNLKWLFTLVYLALLVVRTATDHDLAVPEIICLLLLLVTAIMQVAYEALFIGNTAKTKNHQRTAPLRKAKRTERERLRSLMFGPTTSNVRFRKYDPPNTAGGGPAIDWSRVPRVAFGDDMRRAHFQLEQYFLNSASYGATPKVVKDCKDQWERLIQTNPAYYKNEVIPDKLRCVVARLCSIFNANPEDTVLCTNANQATSSVLKSFPWALGDTFFVLSVDYDATKLAANFLERTHGIETVECRLDLPKSDDEILVIVRAKLEILKGTEAGLPKLANFCHVTSKTAWVFPAWELTALFHEYGIPVMVDGAQAAGHIPIDVNAIGAEWYLGTVHKWMYSCQGVAFLVTKGEDKKMGTIPLQICGLRGDGFREEFEKYGDLDYATWLSVEAGLEFVEKVCGGWKGVRGYCREQARQAVKILEAKWGTKVVQRTQDAYGSMPIMPLPKGENLTAMDAAKVMGYLGTKGITAFLLVTPFNNIPTMCIRCSCQIYTSVSDWTRLGDIVNELGGSYSAMGVVATMLYGGSGGKEDTENTAVIT